MSKKKQLCAYCGKEGSRRELTREHFVPRCLWEGKRPNRTLTVPVHKSCNAVYSQDDEYFRTALIAMNGSQLHPEARRVLEGPLCRVMEKRPRVFLGHLPMVRSAAVETPSGIYVGQALEFALDVPRFYRVLRKIVLGLYYRKLDKPLTPEYPVRLAWDNAQTQQTMKELLPHMEPIADFGDDVFVYSCFVMPSDDRMTFWWLGFYQAFSFFAVTLPNSGRLNTVQSYYGISRMNAWATVLE